MKRVQFILLLSSFMVLLAPVMPYVQYALFEEQIAAYFCENKAMPELNCNGKCYLARQIKAQYEAQKADSPLGFPVAPPSPEEVDFLTYYEKSFHPQLWDECQGKKWTTKEMLEGPQFVLQPLTPPPWLG